jgi:hypothetical protein
VKRAEKYGEIVRTRSGGYELLFPTKMNEELKPYIGKDFGMDMVEEGETLRVTLTHDKRAKPKNRVHASIPHRRDDKETESSKKVR